MLSTALNSSPFYHDRREAGRQLAVLLGEWRRHPSAIVLALPCGGVPVGWEIAHALQLPLDVLIVRKIRHPVNPELTVAAMAAGDATIINHSIAAGLPEPAEFLAAAITCAKKNIRRREGLFRRQRPPLDLVGKIVILADDALVTGATMRAAAQAARLLGATRCLAAVPVASTDACRTLRSEATEITCPLILDEVGKAGHHYEDFSPTSDAEVRELLSRRCGLG
jgi:predicted phosphoribosyltransferase